VSPTGNLQTNLVAFDEAVGSRPQLDLQFLNAIGVRRETPGYQPDDPIQYLAAPENQDFGVVKRLRKKPVPAPSGLPGDNLAPNICMNKPCIS